MVAMPNLVIHQCGASEYFEGQDIPTCGSCNDACYRCQSQTKKIYDENGNMIAETANGRVPNPLKSLNNSTFLQNGEKSLAKA